MYNHGWVKPNPSGLVARCGGPALCSQCSRELSFLSHEEQIKYWEKVRKEKQG
jgi:hypothetical protein